MQAEPDEETGLRGSSFASETGRANSSISSELPTHLESMPLLAAEPDEDEDIENTGCNDVVQFSAPIYYTDENDSEKEVEVIRLGTMKGKVAVTIFTTDRSARASVDYEAVHKQIVFDEGEHTKAVPLTLINAEAGIWNPTLEFKVHLIKGQNCKIGEYLHSCRLKIANCDPFPGNAVKEAVNQGEESIRDMGSWILFRSCFNLIFTSTGRKWQTLTILVLDQITNLFLFVSLWVGVYLVDTIFGGSASSKRLLMPDRYHTAIAISLWYFLPTVALYLWDVLKVHIDIHGVATRFLQACMMQAYLDYTKESRTKVKPPDLKYATNECANAIASGYVAVLEIVRLIGRIITIGVFIVLFFPDPLAVCAAGIIIMVLVICAFVRAGMLQRAQEAADSKSVVMDLLVDEASQKFELVHGYYKRPVMNDMFAKAAKNHEQEKIPVSRIRLGTQYITWFLSGIFVCVYISVKTPAVLTHDLSLGVFLATIGIFTTTLGNAVSDLNNQFLLIVQSFSPLTEFTIYMNLASDLEEHRKKTQARRLHTHNKRKERLLSAGGDEDEAFKSDHIDIEVHGVYFEYASGVPVVQNVNLHLPQGQMIAITGPPKSGKRAFMELLAEHCEPTKGRIMTPSHLRILHLAHEPMFFQASLFSNLCVGLPIREAVDLDRIYEILSIVGIPEMIEVVKNEVQPHDAEKHYGPDSPRGSPRDTFETLLGKGRGSPRQNSGLSGFSQRASNMMNEEIRFEVSCPKWQSSMSHSQQMKLYIACALISNPNILIIDRSIDTLHKEAGLEMLELLRTQVRNRGVCVPGDSINSRRPRNVFYSTKSKSLAVCADTVLKLNPDDHSVHHTVLKTQDHHTVEVVGAQSPSLTEMVPQPKAPPAIAPGG